MDQENKFLVPAVAKIVPKKEQKSFNNKVLLGKLNRNDFFVDIVNYSNFIFLCVEY